MKLHSLKLQTLKHENYEGFAWINYLLNKQDGWMGEQDVHIWKETVLFYLIIVLQEGN